MSHLILFPKRRQLVHEYVMNESSAIANLPTVYLDNHVSFGNEFNIIRAVQEYGPQRIDAINKRLKHMQVEMEKLQLEHETLQQLISVASPRSSR